MTVSVLGPGGYPRPPYGSFSGKPSSGTRGRVSVLGPGGYPKAPYATFAGKTPGAGGGEPYHPTPFGAFHNFGRMGSS